MADKKHKKKAGKTAPKRKRLKSLQKLSKDAGMFLSSEEGKILKKDVVKAAIAMGLLATAASQAQAQVHTNALHQDVNHIDGILQQLHNDVAAGTAGHNSSHSDQAHADVPHTDHTNHSSHQSGGWC